MPQWTCLVCDPPAVIPYAKRASSAAVWRGHCARVHPDGTTPPAERTHSWPSTSASTSKNSPGVNSRDFVRLADKTGVPDDLIVGHDSGEDCCYAVHGLVPTVPLAELAK